MLLSSNDDVTSVVFRTFSFIFVTVTCVVKCIFCIVGVGRESVFAQAEVPSEQIRIALQRKCYIR